jgi:hypothetical protein
MSRWWRLATLALLVALIDYPALAAAFRWLPSRTAQGKLHAPFGSFSSDFDGNAASSTGFFHRLQTQDQYASACDSA